MCDDSAPKIRTAGELDKQLEAGETQGPVFHVVSDAECPQNNHAWVWLSNEAERRTGRTIDLESFRQMKAEAAQQVGEKRGWPVLLRSIKSWTLQEVANALREREGLGPLPHTSHFQRKRAELRKESAEPAGVGKGTRKKAAEYNVEAREYLLEHPDAGPRELKKALGCGMGTVYKLSAFIAVKEQRDKGRKPKKAKAVSLTKEMSDVVPDADGELARLTREQQRDMRSNTVRPRERL